MRRSRLGFKSLDPHNLVPSFNFLFHFFFLMLTFLLEGSCISVSLFLLLCGYKLGYGNFCTMIHVVSSFWLCLFDEWLNV